MRSYVFYPGGQMRESEGFAEDGVDEADPAVPKFSACWTDILEPPPGEIDELAKRLRLDPLTVEHLRHQTIRAHVDELDDYCHIVVYGLLGSNSDELPQPRQLSIVIKDNQLFTLHRVSLSSVDYLSERTRKVATTISKRGVGYLLFVILDKMVENIMLLAKRYEEKLDILESRSVDLDCNDDLLSDLAVVRHEVLSLWRTAIADRELIIELLELELDCITGENKRQMEHVLDHMQSALEIIELLRSLIGEVRENYRTTVSLRSNEAMKKLTVFAGLMMPLTLVAGIYGMNVPLWPNPDAPQTFWLIMGSMAAMMIALGAYFRVKRWL
ncbi:magnesium transporter CorA family protein [Calycomorphotria hydatis]|uniref:magnesium transporter CorA family protein n=1 Tax=Calycomorphotria hydatis TaxID=2528027 RepID=UPI0011A1679A|nr:magnesium transporter CorA family protein [Calycomorphotria hydatis]